MKCQLLTAPTRKQGFCASVDGKLLYLKCSSSQKVQWLKTLPAGSCKTLCSILRKPNILIKFQDWGMILKYTINNYEAFEKGFFSLVDTSVDYSDYRINPWLTKADYFGKMKWGKFTIYHQVKYFLQRRIILKIEGVIKESQLFLKINYHHFFWVSIVSSIFLALFSIFMMTKLPIYFGLILLLITIFQTSWLFRFCYDAKKKLIRQLEEIIKNAA